ncbi:MAG: 30S ribosomal protein S18 [Candidatus Paceibacterota bacterium]
MKNNCICCQEKITNIDYKQTDILRKFVSAQFKIQSSSRTGLCPKHQRKMSRAIKLARYMALLPYTKGQTIKN